jgi:hypothetical protein
VRADYVSGLSRAVAHVCQKKHSLDSLQKILMHTPKRLGYARCAALIGLRLCDRRTASKDLGAVAQPGFDVSNADIAITFAPPRTALTHASGATSMATMDIRAALTETIQVAGI